MPVKISKKTYYLPDSLMNYFAEWCKPGRDYSPKMAGAIFFFMQLSPSIREACEKAAYNENTESAINDFRNTLHKSDSHALADEIVSSSLSDASEKKQNRNRKSLKVV